MLRELRTEKRVAGELKKRWFMSDLQDLVVWQDEDGGIAAFQLSYGKYHAERTIYWKRESGFTHLRVDDERCAGMAPATPLLVADGVCDSAAVAAQFCALSAELPADIAGFVLEKVREYSDGNDEGGHKPG